MARKSAKIEEIKGMLSRRAEKQMTLALWERISGLRKKVFLCMLVRAGMLWRVY